MHNWYESVELKLSEAQAQIPQVKTRIARILEPFGADHSSELIKFFDKVALSDFDLVVFMARKSLCVYRMMELCGARSITKPVYSDSIIESNPELLSQKRVLVVDDTLFVGTTLSDTAARINEANVSEVKYWVFCADVQTWQKKTFHPDYIHLELKAQEALEFCAAECRALINAAVPYLTDFAMSSRIRFKPKELDRAIKPVNWLFYDVSSSYHEDNRVKYYSALPDQLVSERVKETIGGSLFSFIELAKIRTFASWTGKEYDVTFVPVVTFSPTERTLLQKACETLSVAFGVDSELVRSLPVSTQMRVLQYLVGAVYLKTFFEHVELRKSIPADQKFSFSWCSSLFAPELSELLARRISEYYSGALQVKVRGRIPPLNRKEPEMVAKETVDDIQSFLEVYFSGETNTDFGHTPLSDLTAIWLEFQNRFENAARQEIVDQVPEPKYRGRLKRGMAWRALSSYLLQKYKSGNTRYNRNILSLALDRLIDFGIAVPIISESDGFIYRAYRHGEDVRFGAQEESLAHALLEGFEIGRGTKGIEGTYFEKLLVILLRVGMKEEWLSLWYSNSGRDHLARIGYHLQGAVAILPKRDDELVPEGEPSWLTRRLCKTGTVSEVKNKGRPGSMYFPGERPLAGHARHDAVRTAKSIGITIGKACTHSSLKTTDERPLKTDDLIVLTSCANSYDTLAAVSAELRLFAEWFYSSGQRILRGGFERSRANRTYRFLRGDQGEEAVNSGMWKIERFRKGEIESIKQKVYGLEKMDNDWAMREGFWDAIFGAFSKTPSEDDQEKINRIITTASTVFEMAEFVIDLLGKVSGVRQSGGAVGSLELLVKRFEAGAHRRTKYFLSMDQFVGSIGRERFKEADFDWLAFMERFSAELLGSARQVCSLASIEATAAENLVLKSDVRLHRTQYNFVLWYDILDVRVRRQGSPDEIDKYAEGINLFRARASSIISDVSERIRDSGGDVFCDTGEVRSINDEKHIFFSGAGGTLAECNELACQLGQVADDCGIKVRMICVPTNLRGDYVFLNRGTTSIDGDFKSHLHTIIQDLKGAAAEAGLKSGSSILWVLASQVESFRAFGSTKFSFNGTECDARVSVNIRGVSVDTSLSCFTLGG